MKDEYHSSPKHNAVLKQISALDSERANITHKKSLKLQSHKNQTYQKEGLWEKKRNVIYHTDQQVYFQMSSAFS